MSASSKPVDLRIVRVWHDTDDRGRPVTKYAVEDGDGDPVGVFLTPDRSLLSNALFAAVRRNRVR